MPKHVIHPQSNPRTRTPRAAGPAPDTVAGLDAADAAARAEDAADAAARAEDAADAAVAARKARDPVAAGDASRAAHAACLAAKRAARAAAAAADAVAARATTSAADFRAARDAAAAAAAAATRATRARTIADRAAWDASTLAEAAKRAAAYARRLADDDAATLAEAAARAAPGLVKRNPDDVAEYEVMSANAFQDDDGSWSVDDYDYAGMTVALPDGASEDEVLDALLEAGAIEGHDKKELEVTRHVRVDGLVDFFVDVIEGPTLVAVWGTNDYEDGKWFQAGQADCDKAFDAADFRAKRGASATDTVVQTFKRYEREGLRRDWVKEHSDLEDAERGYRSWRAGWMDRAIDKVNAKRFGGS